MGQDAGRYPQFYQLAAEFTDAIAKAKPDNAWTAADRDAAVTGITVPHHLLASDLIAKGFWYAAGHDYDRIVVLLPDHFKGAHTAIATTRRGFETVLGPVDVDGEAVDALVDGGQHIAPSDLFEREHGIRALLPFIRHFFPNVPVVPVAIAPGAKKRDWDALVERLKPLLTPKTLIVQSTDFSHFLPMAKAVQRDQEVLNTLSSGSAEEVATLLPVEHMDAIGAQYVQMKLQKDVFGAELIVVANANSQSYTTVEIDETTSYMVQVFLRGADAAPVLDTIDGQQVFYFAGDTLLGRNLTYLLADRTVAAAVSENILDITRYRPIVLNLEGVILDEVPESMRYSTMTMPSGIAVNWLHRLGVVAVSLANNHTSDMGPTAFAEMRAQLEELEIAVLAQGEIVDLGPFRAAGLTDFRNAGPAAGNLITADLLDGLFDPSKAPPLIAFVHWGAEGETEAGAREEDLSQELRIRGFSAIIGVHSHRASAKIETLAGGQTQRVYSLGNFIFDQTAETASGVLLEVRFFDQGTFFSRLIPIPNYYDAMREIPRTRID